MKKENKMLKKTFSITLILLTIVALTIQMNCDKKDPTEPSANDIYDPNYPGGDNVPPTAILKISTTDSITYYLDASSSYDSDNTSYQLQFRWDWEGDSRWDTKWSSSDTIQHTYNMYGQFEVTVEVKGVRSLTAK